MMARFFNIKMLCAIIVAVLLLGGFAGVEKAAADDASTFLKRSSEKIEVGDYEEAIADLNEAIRLDPNNAVAWNNRGFSKNKLGDYQGAIADLDEAIRLDPNYAVAWNNRGFSKRKLGDYAGAIAN